MIAAYIGVFVFALVNFCQFILASMQTVNAIGNKEEKSRPSSSAEDVVKKLRVILTYLFLSHSLIRMAEDITFLTRSA